MRYEVKKLSKIIDEVVTYFVYVLECPQFELNYTLTDAAYTLDFTFQGAGITPSTLHQLRAHLRGHRQPELEDYYWQLMGNTEEAGALGLVSMMVDEAKLEHEGETIRLSLRRNRT
ncbi:MAG: hypothetical protein R6W89_12615 [Candidatus Hydrogenedentota bacterium]